MSSFASSLQLAPASSECSRARSLRGRPQRFGSRGASLGARSRSGTRCRRPSAEVELRVDLAPVAAASVVEDYGTLTKGFVCNLLDDAVDDFAIDLLHDVDDVQVTPMKAIPRLLLSACETSMTEEVEEDEDICAAASILTARAAEHALAVLGPISPSLSLQANVATPMTVATANSKLETVQPTFHFQHNVPRQLDLGNDEEADDCVSCGSYEEVQSLGSEDSAGEETDNELETMAQVKMALNLAKAAVSKGCSEEYEAHAIEEWSAVEGWAEPEDWFSSQEISAFERWEPDAPRFQNQYAGHVVEDEDQFDLADAKAAARAALFTALLGPASHVEHAVEEQFVEFLGEEPVCSEEIAFDFTSDILGSAFSQAAATWEEKQEMEFFDEGPTSNDELAFDFASNILDGAFVQATATQEEELESLRTQVMTTLSKAAQTGQLQVALEQSPMEAASEADNMQELKLKVRQTLFHAAVEGRLTSTLDQVVQKTADIAAPNQGNNDKAVWAKARNALSKGLQTGKLSNLFSAAIKEDSWAALRSKMQNSFKQGVATGTLTVALKEVFVPSPPALVASAPAPPAENKLLSLQTTPKEPTTPSRTRRRVIGGVIRAPAKQLDLDVATASPSFASQPRLTRRSSRKFATETTQAFHVDIDDRSDVEGQVSKAGARLRAASSSAMAMDLGLGFAGSPPPRASPPSSGPISFASHKRLDFEQKMRPSASLGSLQAPKVCKMSAGLLPSLSMQTSSESIAWGMHMSRTTTGLRRSVSMVF